MQINWIKYGLFIALMLIIWKGGCTLQAEAKEWKLSEEEFVRELLKTKGEEVANQVDFSAQIRNKGVTRERAAYFTAQYLDAAGDTSCDKKIYQNVMDQNRLSDYKQIHEKYRKAVVFLYTKGIMVGDSNGSFSKNRAFSPKSYVSRKECAEIMRRIKNKDGRKRLSPDGQLLRTAHLPMNYKKFPYILASYHNQYYEHTFDYERMSGRTPKEGKDYTNPVNMGKQMLTLYNQEKYSMQTIMDLYLDNWVSKVKENITLRFNVDYRAMEKNTSWIHRLRNTYYVFGNDPEYDMIRTKDITEYVKRIKKNHVRLKAKAAVDRSSLYESNGIFYLRAYVKFRIEEADSLKEPRNIFYGDHVYIRNLKKGQWIEKYFDLAVGACAANSIGDDYAVVFDSLLDSAK